MGTGVNKNILICGYGSAGSYLLDMILKDPNFRDCKIGVMSRSKDKSIPRLELSLVAAGIAENYQDVSFYECDFTDSSRLMNILESFCPDIIVYTGRFMSGHKYGSYSYPNKIGYGVWIPMSVAYIYRLMKVVNKYDKMNNHKTTVINTSYPDGVNPWLDSVGLAPTTGAGNVNHLIPRIKRAVAGIACNRLGCNCVTPDQVDVNLYCSHYANTYISKEGTTNNSPVFMEINGSSTFVDIDQDEIFKACADNTASGQVRNIMIATDCYMICKYMITNKSSNKIHLPGPNGLPGGYSCIIKTDQYGSPSIDVIIPAGMTIDSLVKTNSTNMMFDGIENISGGDLTFTDQCIKSMDRVFGIKYPKSINIDDAEEFATVISKGLDSYDSRR